jgi:hypothetical protein
MKKIVMVHQTAAGQPMAGAVTAGMRDRKQQSRPKLWLIPMADAE